MVAVERINLPNAQSEENMTGLEGMEAIRMRPGMYIGGNDIAALHHLVYEVVDNSIDEAMAGRCDTITVTIHEGNSISIEDDGGGIPVGTNPKFGISTLEAAFTKLHFGGKFGMGAYLTSGGLHGIGLKAVNAMSDWLRVQVAREGKIFEQRYARGAPTSKVETIGTMPEGSHTGTRVTFYPDLTVMQTNAFDFKTLADRFRQKALLVSRVTIRVIDEREQPIPLEKTYYYEGGVRTFVQSVNHSRDGLHSIVSGKGSTKFVYELDGDKRDGTIESEFAFQYTESSNPQELAFANTIRNPDGGTHLTGFRTALTRILNSYARKEGYLKDKDKNFTGSTTLDGLTVIISVRHPNPQFESQTKVKLLNQEVAGAVGQVVSDAFQQYLEDNPKEAKKIMDKCLSTQRIQDALDKQRDLLMGERKSFLSNTTLPGKLADCSDRGMNTEIIIVEGDSAGGCFSGDTKIALVGDRELSFAEIIAEQAEGKRHYCYTVNTDGTIGTGEVINPRITKRNAEVIRLTLSNGEQIVCTPDHQFMLLNGQYKAASELNTSELLKPIAYKTFTQEEGTLVAAGSNAPKAYTMLYPYADVRITVSGIEHVHEKIDVYDIEVPGTHNFALASGVFVHNSAKQARDRHFQAILPVFGKILNTERVGVNKILDSDKIRMLIMALGTGIRDDFNAEKMRYGRIILLSDADVDGAHIRTLMLTFFYRYMPGVITLGRLFIGQPPIFRLEHKKNVQYVYPEAGLREEALLSKWLKGYSEPEKVGVQRYKGLGEMNPEQLWETTLNPEKRMLLQVRLDDAVKADQTFDMLMGPEVPPRKTFIMTHSKEATLDI